MALIPEFIKAIVGVTSVEQKFPLGLVIETTERSRLGCVYNGARHVPLPKVAAVIVFNPACISNSSTTTLGNPFIYGIQSANVLSL